MNGVAGDVFRAPKRDRHGDPVELDGVTPVEITDKDGNAFIGTLTEILMGSVSATRVLGRQESADGGGQLGILKTQTPKVRFADRIVIGGQTFEVTSDPNWDAPHVMSGTVFPRYWVDVIYRR